MRTKKVDCHVKFDKKNGYDFTNLLQKREFIDIFIRIFITDRKKM